MEPPPPFLTIPSWPCHASTCKPAPDRVAPPPCLSLGLPPVAANERYEPLTPWCMLVDPGSCKVASFARRINNAALSALAELFLMNGDMCAWLYTGSPAMHSGQITIFEPENSRLRKAGAGSYGNSFIAIRRWGWG